LGHGGRRFDAVLTMTRGEEHSIERAVGRIEANQEAMAENFKAMTEAFMAIKAATEPMRSDIAELKRRADMAAEISDRFNALDQSIHDRAMQAKGVLIGVGIAGGAAGATVATGIKWIAATFWGQP
jgi:hypothetical protein